ncbi:SRPBCC family protein [Paenibacillus sp. YN15]|uniref:SRPBCC family protein n=1 Tax=Paenibacillus sp. YN15 TaxID=1742774 RepID=UPI000DCF2211|nr:SRPBCC family protein [Paenibacillus sp. YN15]RAV00223.1 activator of Hsp90 ATPase 1 family protein [Paenibacillus sp. YN15]
MLAVLQQTKDGYIARFERHLKHSVEKVWASLTENDKLKKWFSELQVEDLRQGGVIKFDMQDGTFEELKIIELKLHSVLEYTWGEDQVRFELFPEADGCRLVLIEKINKLTSHTPKDLAGWHVCLDVIKALLDEQTLDSRENEWEKWYKEYAQSLNQFRNDS